MKAGKGHYWFGIEKDLATLADWFDRHLLDAKRPTVVRPPPADGRHGHFRSSALSMNSVIFFASSAGVTLVFL